MALNFSCDANKKVKPLERKVVLANCESALVNFEELPEYMKDNEFIRNYYRCEWPLKDVALSIFSLHNETINIWTSASLSLSLHLHLIKINCLLLFS